MSFGQLGMRATEMVTTMLSARAENGTTSEAHSVTVAKGLCILVVFVVTAVIGYLPFVLDRWFNFKDSDPGSKTGIVMRFLLYFGGGSLFCVTFQHILVEVSEDVAALQASERLPATAFDLTLFLMCIGFMVMFLVEELIHLYMNHHKNELPTRSDASKLQNGDAQPELSAEPSRKAIVDVHLPPSGYEQESVLISSLRGLLVVLALSIHALFEGLAVGLQPTADSVWYVTGAIIGHKLVLAFSIGIELIAAKVRLWLGLTYVFVFTIVAPIGIAIGIGLTSDAGADVPSVIIQGLAAGTLVYVTFFEILFKERSGLWTYAGFVIGFFTLYGIIIGTHDVERPVYCVTPIVENPTTPYIP